MSRLNKICNSVIAYSFYLLFFLVPLIMTPWNYELFEFNKMLLVYFFTILIISSWLIKMVLQKRIIFQRSFWDIPLLVFLISQLISFFLSIDQHTSLWGYYSRFNGGLVSLVCYLLLYWAFVSNMDKDKTRRTLFYLLSSATLVAVYGLAEHFGIDEQAWVQDVRNRVFSTLGQPNWLAAWLVALIPLTWSFALIENFKLQIVNRKNLKFNRYIYYLLFTLYYLCLLYTKSRSGILGFTASFIVFWGILFLISFLKRQKNYSLPPTVYTLKIFAIFTFFILLLTLLIPTPWQPKFLKPQTSKNQVVSQEIPTGGTESGEIRKIVWKGALEIWKHYPLFGTGGETFAYSYYWYRPREHNDTSEWDFLYNKAHNEYLNYMATTGTVGLLAYLGLIGTFIFWSLKGSLKNLKSQMLNLKTKSKISKLKNQKLSDLSCGFEFCALRFAFLSGFSSILVTNFFGFSVVAVNLLFFLFPALSAVLASPSQGVNSLPPLRQHRNLGIWSWVAIGVILFCALRFLFCLAQYWSADKLFALSDRLSKSDQKAQAFTQLQRAVQIRPEPLYHDELGITAAELATTAFQQKQATLSAQLAEMAIQESNQALKLSPYNINFWKNRTRLFYSLSEIDPKYNQEALKSLLRASELAPTDAKIAYNLGLLYSKLGQEETALQILEKTIELKPNYDQARYALGLFYEKQGKIDKAKEQYQYILEKINPQDEQVLEKLKKLK